MIIKGTVYSIDSTGLRFVSKITTGIILIFEGVSNPVEIKLQSQIEIDRQYAEIIAEWEKHKL